MRKISTEYLLNIVNENKNETISINQYISLDEYNLLKLIVLDYVKNNFSQVYKANLSEFSNCVNVNEKI